MLILGIVAMMMNIWTAKNHSAVPGANYFAAGFCLAGVLMLLIGLLS